MGDSARSESVWRRALSRLTAGRRQRQQLDEAVRQRRAEFDRLLFVMEREESLRPGTWPRGEIERRRILYEREIGRLEQQRHERPSRTVGEEQSEQQGRPGG